MRSRPYRLFWTRSCRVCFLLRVSVLPGCTSSCSLPQPDPLLLEEVLLPSAPLPPGRWAAMEYRRTVITVFS